MFSSYDSIYFISCVLGMSAFAWHNPNPLYSLFKEHFLYSGKISPPEHIHIISYELRLVKLRFVVHAIISCFWIVFIFYGMLLGWIFIQIIPRPSFPKTLKNGIFIHLHSRLCRFHDTQKLTHASHIGHFHLCIFHIIYNNHFSLWE